MKRTLFVSLVSLVCLSQVWAQAGAGTGTVTGIVKEGSTDDRLPQTTVILTNPALGLRRVMTTTDDGLFTAAALYPSTTYRLKITRKGFSDWESGDFEVNVGQAVNLEIALKRTAETQETASAPAPAPRIREVTAGTESLTTEAQVNGLPSKQRRVDSLAATAPTVTTDARSGRMVIRGQPFSNVFLADGVATTNSYYQERAAIAPQLPLDEIHELQVQLADYPAEFGGAAGGAIDAATRSGSANYPRSAHPAVQPRRGAQPGQPYDGDDQRRPQPRFQALDPRRHEPQPRRP